MVISEDVKDYLSKCLDEVKKPCFVSCGIAPQDCEIKNFDVGLALGSLFSGQEMYQFSPSMAIVVGFNMIVRGAVAGVVNAGFCKKIMIKKMNKIWESNL